MPHKLMISIGVLMYAVVVPILEINASHVFNPQWPEHARLHEVWQLVTNSALGAWCLNLAWARGDVRLPSLIALFVTGGFFAAYLLGPSYGGSMLHTDGTERTLLGINVGVIGFGAVMLMSLWTLLRAPDPRDELD